MSEESTGLPPAIGWAVLALVFLDEILLVAGAWVAAAAAGGSLAGAAASIAVVAAWWVFASPHAPRGGPVTRPVTKVLVVAGACGGLWAAGHERVALVLLAFSVVINLVALLPSVSGLPGQVARPEGTG